MSLPTNLVIVGLHSERPGSGKTTVAAALAPIVGGNVYSIAEPIRAEARELGFHAAADALGAAKNVALPELGGLSPRQVLILIGEARVAKYGRTYWLDIVIAQAADDAHQVAGPHVAVIDDVRRPEEGRALIDLGATVCTIERDGVPDVRDINGWRSDVFHTFRNDGTPDDCAQRIWGRSLMDRARVRA